ncbi:glycosyltransferase family 76 protein [Hygrophoropsis aurantiaca]|uniref:Glycosyltransferase family 76 protein n=1 Tax=Hygrophoropsis aurantiaca TaxID=72124 RepID=A0ACB8AI06_9AGAM|nr:glycosyltransferase family 76 protein [Hygrophoropsis aurantiaca]
MQVSAWKARDRNVCTLLVLAVIGRALTWVVISVAASSLPLFDSSPKLVLDESTPPWISALLRWDAFHFAHVAEKGYVYEHEWAFFVGTPFTMRVSSKLLSLLGGRYTSSTWATFLQGGALTAIACDSTRILYHLSLHHLRSPNLAFVSAALSLLPSSPATLKFASYSEPFFTYLSYKGLLACSHSQWFFASICFTLAGAFRSNGFMLCGFILWGMLVDPFLRGKKSSLTLPRIAYTTILVALPIVPFIQHNYTAYRAFCSSTQIPTWCNRSIFPLIYSHVQSKYWNVGLLRYWTLQNIPNFIIALPVLLNLFTFSAFYIPRVPSILWGLLHEKHKDIDRTQAVPKSPFLSPSLLPHTIHAFLLTLILTLAAHTQTALRALPCLPITYWAAARLLVEHPKWGKAWVVWSIIWGAISCVLWAVFLPPA